MVDILIGSGTLFPDTYVMSLLLRSKIMIKSNTDIKKSFELVLEAETIATVEDDVPLIIDSKLAIIENLLYQKNVSSIPDKLKDVEELVSTLVNAEEKSEKLQSFKERLKLR